MAGSQGRRGDPPSFSRELDQRIIDGLLDDQEATLRELEESGFPRSVVLDRAGKLGLTGELLRRHRRDRIEITIRRCLNCEETFLSTGMQNRLCSRCRRKQ